MKYFIIFFVFSLVNSNDFINVKELDMQSKSELKKYMKIISKDLGVKCNHCHDLEDKSIDTEEKEIAREMIRLTRYLNDLLNDVSEKDENYKKYVSCWTCHHGKLEPQHSRPIE